MPKQLTPRALILGALGSVVITASSLYVALRLGALPWPTIFVAILSMALLKLFGKTSLQEVNITHTAMSAGAMVAGGLAFTAPALWILNPETEFSFLKMLSITLSGTLLGLAATALFRRYFIETRKEEYTYPIGAAAYETVSAGDDGGRHALWLFSSLGLTALFTVFRDKLGKIPALINFEKLAEKNIFAGIWISPMAMGIGYIIGPLYTGVWAIGALLGFGLIVPVGLATGIFETLANADAFRSSLGIGLMVGTGIGVLIKGILPQLRPLIKAAFGKDEKSLSSPSFLLTAGIVAIVALTLGTDFRNLGGWIPVAVIVTVLGASLASLMAAVLTGQTGINPMEILGILVLLVVKIFAPEAMGALITAAAVTAVAAGLAGDVMNDYKAGALFGTNPRAQRIAETTGALIGAVVSVAVLYALVRSNGAGSLGDPTVFPAPQARAVAALAGGIPHLWAFIAGALFGTIFFIVKIPAMTLGLGLYLPVFITAPILLGGLWAFVEKLLRNAQGKAVGKTGTVIASGLLGGEAVTGVVIAIITLVSLG
ncbi:MAG: OPT/YSL family transporter [Spirochaetales bacterium]|nr:OPT/YSL family transporter [Spirochaetales bacterium]